MKYANYTLLSNYHHGIYYVHEYGLVFTMTSKPVLARGVEGGGSLLCSQKSRLEYYVDSGYPLRSILLHRPLLSFHIP